MASVRIAHITDMHIAAGHKPYGRDTTDSLSRVLAAIAALQVDAIIATGDLVNDAARAEYDVLRALLQQAPAPIFLLPGNHDDADALRAVFYDHTYLPKTGDLSYAVDLGGIRIVMLDDTVAGEVGGAMTDERAAWLAATLQANPTTPTLLGLHHPPFNTGDPGFDAMGLMHADRLAAVLHANKQVRRVVCGHFHRASVGEIGGVACVVAPSTAWQFQLALRAGEPHTPPTREPVGFVVHIASPTGEFSSLTQWL